MGFQQQAISKAQDAITVKRVYGEPYERDGVVVIPAAEIRGSGGGGRGSGEDATRGGSGSGGGFGLGARPVGAYLIEGGQVRWEPAVDITRIVLQVTFAALGVAFPAPTPAPLIASGCFDPLPFRPKGAVAGMLAEATSIAQARAPSAVAKVLVWRCRTASGTAGYGPSPKASSSNSGRTRSAAGSSGRLGLVRASSPGAVRHSSRS